MLLWVIRAFFIVIIAAVLLVNLTDPVISGGAGRTDFFAILWCALGLVAGREGKFPRNVGRLHYAGRK